MNFTSFMQAEKSLTVNQKKKGRCDRGGRSSDTQVGIGAMIASVSGPEKSMTVYRDLGRN